MDWLDLLTVQRTLKSVLQHHTSKASILQCSAFPAVQLPHPYTTTGKTTASTRRNLVGKVTSLLFSMLSKMATAFSKEQVSFNFIAEVTICSDFGGVLLSCVRLFATPWTVAYKASLSFTVFWSLLRPMSIESMMPSHHLILCRPFSSCPQSFPASGSFPVGWLFASSEQDIRALASLLPMNIQD